MLFCFCLQGPEDGEESDSNAAIQTEKQTEVRSSEVGRVMTEEEYEEWKKEREGGKQNEEDTGIDWGMGNNLYIWVKIYSALKEKRSLILAIC